MFEPSKDKANLNEWVEVWDKEILPRAQAIGEWHLTREPVSFEPISDMISAQITLLANLCAEQFPGCDAAAFVDVVERIGDADHWDYPALRKSLLQSHFLLKNLFDRFEVIVDGEGSAPIVAARPPIHSDDFTSVNWFGTPYPFRKGQQADAVRVLWRAWEKGLPGVHEDAIGKAVESNATPFRLKKVFEHNRAWGTLIVPVRGAKKMFTLNGEFPK